MQTAWERSREPIETKRYRYFMDGDYMCLRTIEDDLSWNLLLGRGLTKISYVAE